MRWRRKLQVLPFAFFLDDDVGQYLAGDVFAGLGVKYFEVRPLLDHGRKMVERDVTAG